MSITAMKQALEALDELACLGNGIYSIKAHNAGVAAITALRAAIEAQERCEPVAWKTIDNNGHYAMWGQKPMSDYWVQHSDNLIPLFTHPAPVPAGYMEIYVGNKQFAKIDVEDYDKVKGYWWSLSTKRGFTQYAQAHSSHDSKSRLHLSMHRVILGLTDTGLVDHINGDGLDNRKSNLRIATTQENAFNQKSNRGSSKFKGVSFRKDNNLWRAYVTKDGKRTYLGDHATEIDAAMAYNKAASQLFGEYARLNNVD